jgi:hypothetical protein
VAKVRVKNVSKGNVGLSFTWLPVGATSVVEEDVISEADKRLINKGLVNVVPFEAEPAEEAEPEKVDETPADDQAVETAVEEEKTEETEEEEPAEEEVEEEKTEEEEPAADEPEGEPEADDAAESKTYTKEELDALNMGQLREVAEPLGVHARSKDDMIAKILEATSSGE